MGQVFVPLTRVEIARAKTLALRRGVWFRVLTRVERACVDLSARVVGDKVRSCVLARVLNSILCKLRCALESVVERAAREFGRPLAQRLSAIAQKWGNRSAVAWSKDRDFIRYLAVCWVNAG